MSYRTLIILFPLLGTLLSRSYAQTSESPSTSQPLFSLEDCLEYAYQHNANVENAVLEQGIAARDVSVTKAQGFPQLNANVGYTNNYIIQTSLIEADGFPGSDPNAPPSDELIEAQFGITNQAQAGVTLEQMIFDGSYFVGLKAARVYTNLARKALEQTRAVTAEQVTKAYYTALVNQERQSLLASNYQRLDTLLRETQLMFENGFAEKIDVSRIRVQFNNARTQLESNERLVEVSYLLLKFQMGMPIERDIQLVDKISDIEFDYELAEEQNFTYADRPEFAQVQINQNLTKLDMQNNRVQYLPKLTAIAAYGYNGGASQFSQLVDFNSVPPRWFNNGFWGINLSIPIFDGLRKHNLIQKNKLQIQQLENQADFLKNQIDLEIVQARVTLRNNREILAVQQENLELAQEVFDVSKVKYQEGVGSNLEVTEAQNALQQAETNYYNALYDALVAKVDLKKAMGILVDESELN